MSHKVDYICDELIVNWNLWIAIDCPMGHWHSPMSGSRLTTPDTHAQKRPTCGSAGFDVKKIISLRRATPPQTNRQRTDNAQ